MSTTSDTLTGTTDPLREAREHVVSLLNDAHTKTADAKHLAGLGASWLPATIFRDPSKLGAHRARLNLACDWLEKAAALIAEVSADVVDMTYRPGVDSGEEG